MIRWTEAVNLQRKTGIIIGSDLLTETWLMGVIISEIKKTQVPYAVPSRADIARSVATSTAVETGQSSAKIEASLEETRKRFAHLRLAV